VQALPNSTTPSIPSSVANNAQQAGDKARDSGRCLDIFNNPTSNTVQLYLNSANSGLGGLSFPPVWSRNLQSGNSASPPPSCTTLSLPYWNDWDNQVFYQVADKYSPNGVGSQILTINGTGNNRAVVIVARRPLPAQVRVATNPTTYLEGLNQHINPISPATTPPPAPTFVSNSISDPNYQTANDLVLCLDGQVNCK
jgi:hypothetical protein